MTGGGEYDAVGAKIALHDSCDFIAAKSGTINGSFVTYDTYVAKCAGNNPQMDVNADGVVDGTDLDILRGAWG